jgi:chromate reductase, NAD(P)H dehydrogenase (quinone)
MKKIFALCGSTRQNSINLELLKIISDLEKETIELQIFTQIGYLPHFNPDIDNPEHTPTFVEDFRNKLKEADGVLICTPEYAMGVPGTLKNALDWTVSSMEFSQKPTALITASTSGEKGHQSLLETLKVIEAKIDDKTSLLISTPKTKIKDGVITDEETLNKVKAVLSNLIKKSEKL